MITITRSAKQQEQREDDRIAFLVEQLANGNMDEHMIAELAVLRHRKSRRASSDQP